jgi:nucleotide-binding universal stress UspA family protein
MSFKTILVHCDGAEPVNHPLAVGADLASRFEAVLLGVHAKAPFEPPLFVGKSFDMARFVQAHRQHVMEDQAVALAAFEDASKSKRFTAEWRSHNGRADQVMVRCSRYSDLVIVGQTRPDGPTLIPGDLPEAVAIGGGRPVLVVPHVGVRKPVGVTVILCWNASRESARAAADALPFLRSAAKVVVLVVEPTASYAGHGEEPGADIAIWLARHGAKVTVQCEIAPDVGVGEIILSRAADHDADLIVMGVYGHLRLREAVLGGVSRTMLSSMTVPVLMSH